MQTILCVIGTRPEAIKMAPVVQALARRPGVRVRVCLTGQHRELVDQVLEDFGIRPDPDLDLDLMRPGQSLAALTAALVEALDGVLRAERPGWVLAQGDTTTVLAASLAAFYQRVRFGHVEAGLRTGDLRRPFPEELNRYVADRVADLLFAPTERSRQALLAEGHAPDRIVVTGNTVIDALRAIAAQPFDWDTSALAALPRDRRLVLVTAHRRESFGGPLAAIASAIAALAGTFHAAGWHFVFPVHPNPNVREPIHAALGATPGVSLIEPLGYRALVYLLKRCALVLTDSGGLQEEAAGLGVPVLVLRETTERPEGVDAGIARLAGTTEAQVVAEAGRLLADGPALASMARSANPYGDGRAAERIVAALLDRLGDKSNSL